jgi:hypothetical protein
VRAAGPAAPDEQRLGAASALSGARALYGAALLLAPRRALGMRGGAVDTRVRAFALVLGARNLLEAAILHRHPRRGWALAGAAVDAAHAASMVGGGGR